MSKINMFTGFLLQDNPLIYIASIPGKWLLKHTTPSWRIKDPILGFQRMVNEERARKIAIAVLDQQRSFPNSIVLATNIKKFNLVKGSLEMNNKTLFLVVDGQHRLYAQYFSKYDALYSCCIHCNLTEIEMARLFLEINDNQKRVPSSLRWDLVRLVRPEGDPYAIAATELVYALATNETSPLYQRIDLTGEQHKIALKQGSLAPEVKNLISRNSSVKSLNFEQQYDLLEKYIKAIKSLDSSGWIDGETPFYQARILRMLIKVMPELIAAQKKQADRMTVADFLKYLKKIDQDLLTSDMIRAAQGAAGMKAIYDEIKSQIFR